VKQAILVLLAAAAFVALAFYQLQAEGAVECEACVEVEGNAACGTVAAPTDGEARARAVSLACSIATHGVTRTLQCERGTPTSLVCKER
jgi:hypothetical protein